MGIYSNVQQKLLNNRYGVSGLLGSGGMAKVYLAYDEVLGREVALKVLREQYAENDEFVERFRREAQAAASLSHPNIVAIYDRGCSEDGSYYIVMEYVPGGTLKDRIVQDGPLAPHRAAELAAQIAGALGAAHESGVIHRDVKPQNVLLTAAGDVKVTDFGIARAASEASISGTSTILGTVSYMSPEQAMGKVVGPGSDLYSLGVVLHEMLAGKVPFEAETPMAVSMKHVNQPPPSLNETSPGLPEGLNAIRAKLLAKDPKNRYASAAEVVEDLRRVGRGEKPLLVGPVPRAQDAPTDVLPGPLVAIRGERRWRPLVLRTGAALVGVLGLVGVFGWGLSDSEGRSQQEGVVAEAREFVTGQAEVSDVLGLDRAEAQGRLIDEGFAVDVRPRESTTEDEGKVLSQSVPAGDEAEKGTRVVLDIGDGPAPVATPELTGLTLATAEDVLAKANLKVGKKEEEPSETVPAGEVIEQNPPADEEVEPGTAVDLVLSSGPADPPPSEPPPPPPSEPPPPPAAPPAEAPVAEPAPEDVVEPEQYEPETPAASAPQETEPPPEPPVDQYDEPPATPSPPPQAEDSPAAPMLSEEAYDEPAPVYAEPAPAIEPEDESSDENDEYEDD